MINIYTYIHMINIHRNVCIHRYMTYMDLYENMHVHGD